MDFWKGGSREQVRELVSVGFMVWGEWRSGESYESGGLVEG